MQSPLVGAPQRLGPPGPDAAIRPVARRSPESPLRLSLGGARLPLALLIIVSVSRVHQYFGFLAVLRPALLLFAWAVIALMLAKASTRFSMENLKELPTRLTLALGGAAVLSALFGISLGHSATFILNEYWKVIALALMVAAACRTTDDLWTMLWAYVIGVGLMAWMCLTVFRMEAGANGFSRLGDGFSLDANDMGLICVTGIPLCLITLRTSRRLGKIASILIIALACIAIARTGSRGAFLALLTVALAFLVSARSITVFRRISIGVVGAAALSIAAPPGYLKQMSTIIDPTQDYNWTSRTGRKEVAERGLGYLQRNPVTGIGIKNFTLAEGLFSEAAVEFEAGGAGVKWSAPHNSFLEALVEMGVIGGALFVTLVGTGVIGVRRLRRRVAQRTFGSRMADTLMSGVVEYLPITFLGFAVGGAFLSFAYLDPVYLLAAFATATFALTRRAAAASAPRVLHPQRKLVRV